MTVKVIQSFSGEYEFLSNFYPSVVTLANFQYKTVEHAYQAAKFTGISNRTVIRIAQTPGQAKKLGRSLGPPIEDWDELKIGIMANLLKQKFSQDLFKQKLADTGEDILIEGNTWGDTFWGVCDGLGHNLLGILLMNIRTLNATS